MQTQGLMIAYVRDGLQIIRHLADTLVLPKVKAGLGSPMAAVM